MDTILKTDRIHHFFQKKCITFAVRRVQEPHVINSVDLISVSNPVLML